MNPKAHGLQIVAACLGLSLAPSAQAQSYYEPAEAYYVTSSRNPEVIQYVLCLEAEVNNLRGGQTISSGHLPIFLELAQGACENDARRLPNSPNEPDEAEIRQMIAECGFRPGDASPDMGCDARTSTVTSSAPPLAIPGVGNTNPPARPGLALPPPREQAGLPRPPTGSQTAPRTPTRTNQLPPPPGANQPGATRPGVNQSAGNLPPRVAPVRDANAFRFEDFLTRVYSGRVVAPDLSSHSDARTYRTRLRDAAKGGINFAGEYILATWGCGAQCLMGAAINARTGSVHFLPGTICCWFEMSESTNPIDYRPDSNLIVFNGLLNEEDPMARHYYEFLGGNFRLLQRQSVSSAQPASESKRTLTASHRSKIRRVDVNDRDNGPLS